MRRAVVAGAMTMAVGCAAGPGAAGAAGATAAPRDACPHRALPTRVSALRAWVPAGTPVRARLAQPAPRAPVAVVGAWRLVLRAHRTAHGCLLRVRLDRRPNGAHGWVAARRVTVRRTRWRIEVDRAARRAALLHAGRAVARWKVVVGKPSTPTPRGLFAIQASYRTPASSFAGAWILALSAHSEVLTTYEGGDGQVALHGRGGASLDDPLGTAASHGCVRFDNRAIGAIVRRVGRARLPGTPVAIS
jgi:hypothetical protein